MIGTTYVCEPNSSICKFDKVYVHINISDEQLDKLRCTVSTK